MVAITTDETERAAALQGLAGAAYRLSAADARLRGRATRVPGALSMTHARALRVLAERGPLSVSQLAQGAEITGAATTQLVHGLVSAGYVARQELGTDRRSVTVALTAAGRQRHQQRSELIQKFLAERLAAFSVADLEAASEIISQLTQLYDQL